MKRSEHSGNVLERRAFLAALFERAGGLTFEINDDEVVAGEEDLAEMIVAVDARSHRGTLESGGELEAPAGDLFDLENSIRPRAGHARAFRL